jgi:hypothetical protein
MYRPTNVSTLDVAAIPLAESDSQSEPTSDVDSASSAERKIVGRVGWLTNIPIKTARIQPAIRITGLSSQQTRLHLQLLGHMEQVRTNATTTTQDLHRSETAAWKDLIQYVHQTTVAITTRRKLIGSAIGATRRAETYGYREWGRTPQFVYDALHTLEAQIMKVKDLDLPGLTPEALGAILAKTVDPEVRLYTLILYLSAHRSTSLQSVQCKDVKIDLHPVPKQLVVTDVYSTTRPRPTEVHSVTIRFREGKTQRSTKIYAITILLPEPMVAVLRTLLQGHQTRAKLFSPQTARKASANLKSHGSEIRALRRGALRTMALQGSTAAELRLLSRHTSDTATYQYVGGGLYLRHEAMTQLQLQTPMQNLLASM